MKKCFIAFALLITTLTANAQFEKGKIYFESALNSIGASFNGDEEFKFGAELKTGFFIADCWMLNAHAGYTHYNRNINRCTLGLGTRYYLLQNGVYAELNVNGIFEPNHNDIMPGVELGYAFFINDKVTIEPALYYDHSFSDHKNYSTVGLKIGFGLYF